MAALALESIADMTPSVLAERAWSLAQQTDSQTSVAAALLAQAARPMRESLLDYLVSQSSSTVHIHRDTVRGLCRAGLSHVARELLSRELAVPSRTDAAALAEMKENATTDSDLAWAVRVSLQLSSNSELITGARPLLAAYAWRGRTQAQHALTLAKAFDSTA